MQDFFKRNNLKISLFLSSIALVMVLLSQNEEIPIRDAFSTVIQTITYPFRQAASLSSETLAEFWTDYVFLLNVEEENKLLKRKNAELLARNIDLREKLAKEERRMQLPQAEEKVPYKFIQAEVVYEGANTYSKILLLNRGTNDGVRKNFAVIAAKGIIGKVIEVFSGFSKVRLLIDPRSSTSAILQNSRVRGILEGVPGEELILQFIPADVSVKTGDRVISSGLSGIYPKGLNLGTVASISKNEFSLFQKVKVKPAVEFHKLEEVLIILESRAKEYKTLFQE